MKPESIILVMGSTAIDQTGVYNGSFEDYQAQYPIEAMNASFQLSSMKTSFGGCAPNIAYGLQQLGVRSLPLSSAGRNFRDHYLGHLQSNGIETAYIAIDDSLENSASCLMINDLEGNQIIGFYPGPGSEMRKLPSEISEIAKVELAVLGPEAPDLTLRQARDLSALGIPMVFDPGQVATEFNESEIMELLSLCNYLIVNDYEHAVIKANASLTGEQIIDLVGEVVITHGEKGAGIFTSGGAHHVDAVPDIEIIEVTGCGDAFRAGYCYGILAGLDPVGRGQMGCLMAACNLQSPETQRYRVTLEEILERQTEVYG